LQLAFASQVKSAIQLDILRYPGDFGLHFDPEET
jgi:hypothetical protein